jgi:hypothetical protein
MDLVKFGETDEEGEQFPVRSNSTTWGVTKLEECCLGPGGNGSYVDFANPEYGSYFVVVCSGQATTDLS